MPKRAKHHLARPAPVQLPLFAEAASLARIRPERNEWRFYRMEVWPDLFGRALLLRQWGRIGTEGRRRLDPTPIRAPHSTSWHGWRTRSAAAATWTAPHDQAARCPQNAGEESEPATPSAMGLYTADGARKYLTAGEREAFLRAAERADREARTLCMTLAYGGCRLSEALALTTDSVDLAGGLLLFESLKKRRRGIHRAVPVPPGLLDALDLVHGIRKLQSRRGKGRGVRLWPWSRMTGWRIVHRGHEMLVAFVSRCSRHANHT